MRLGGVLNLLGKMLIVLSLMLLTPLPFSFYYHDQMHMVFLLSSGLGLVLGGVLVSAFLPERDLGYTDGFAIVTLAWTTFALLGSLPYLFSGAIPSLTDAYFESISGFTTTGSTILADIERLPKSLLFWRTMTHWLGGMGIIVLTLAVLPFLGIGGMQVFQAEVKCELRIRAEAGPAGDQYGEGIP